MIKLCEINDDIALRKVLSSSKLSERFSNYIYDCEMDYISDKIDCFPSNSITYYISAYEPSYIKVIDASDFLDGVQKSAKYFGCSERLDALIKQCYALKYKNLFAYMVNKLAKMYFDEEIKPTLDFVERCSYAIHCKDADDCLIDYIECFVDCHCDNVYINEDNELIEIVKL